MPDVFTVFLNKDDDDDDHDDDDDDDDEYPRHIYRGVPPTLSGSRFWPIASIVATEVVSWLSRVSKVHRKCV